jgi:hypothetical protein
LVHIIADVLCFENRLFPLGMGYRVCFAGGRVTPFSGFSTTNWAFKVYCVHADSLRRSRSRSRPVENQTAPLPLFQYKMGLKGDFSSGPASI